MPFRRPRTELTLGQFLEGFVAVLAMKGRRHLDAIPGVLDVALSQTLPLLSSSLDRHKVRLRFRIRSDALSRPRSNLSTALADLERQRLIRRGETGDGLEIVATNPQAYVTLEAIEAPVQFFERAVKEFRRVYATARLARVREVVARRSSSIPRGTSTAP